MHGYWTEFFALATIHFLAVVAPGPDFAITIRQSIRFGRQIGVITALGIGAGISLHVAYTLIGVGALFHANPWLLKIASIFGALYLIYLGFNLIRSSPKKIEIKDENDVAGLKNSINTDDSTTKGKAFITGFLTNATNPKDTLFFLAIFTTIVSTSTPLIIQLFYGIWMCMVNALWFALVAMLFTVKAIREKFLLLGYLFERFMGALLLIFAARMIWQLFS
jgi:threonine/homoserine/homoserine lactone efflux protein